MGSTLLKLIDAILVLFYLVIFIAAPLIDAQTCLPLDLFPSYIVELKKWYAEHYGDYLVSEKPHFFVGIVWLELFFQWPLSMACIYGILSGKSWSGSACLVYGASTLTSMVAILSELKSSNRASDKLLMMYYPFLGLALLSLLRGVITHSGKSVNIARKPAPRKKRA